MGYFRHEYDMNMYDLSESTTCCCCAMRECGNGTNKGVLGIGDFFACLISKYIHVHVPFSLSFYSLFFFLVSVPPRFYALDYNLALGPLHPASSATISAHRSPIASTVSIGFTLVISGKTPASAIRTPFKPLSLNSQSTTAISSRARSPIFVVPAGW